MNLYEVQTGWVGESYERCYVWATDEDEARSLFATKFPQKKADVVQHLLCGDNPAPFITDLSDCGWAT